MIDGVGSGAPGADSGEPQAEEPQMPGQPRDPGASPELRDPRASPEPRDPGASPEPREPRPVIERIGLASVALVLALLFGGVAAASWVGGEPFLAVMSATGSLVTIWVGALTLLRG